MAYLIDCRAKGLMLSLEIPIAGARGKVRSGLGLGGPVAWQT